MIGAHDLLEGRLRVGVVVGEGQVLKVVSGKRHTWFKRRDLEEYVGERGKRGLALPRGFQKVAAVAVE